MSLVPLRATLDTSFSLVPFRASAALSFPLSPSFAVHVLYTRSLDPLSLTLVLSIRSAFVLPSAILLGRRARALSRSPSLFLLSTLAPSVAELVRAALPPSPSGFVPDTPTSRLPCPRPRSSSSRQPHRFSFCVRVRATVYVWNRVDVCQGSSPSRVHVPRPGSSVSPASPPLSLTPSAHLFPSAARAAPRPSPSNPPGRFRVLLARPILRRWPPFRGVSRRVRDTRKARQRRVRVPS